jgi:hypothetical protein
MATRRIFWGFCINRFGIHYTLHISSRFDFGFEFEEIFVIEKRLPDSASREVGDSASRGVGDSQTHRVFFKHSKADSPTRRVGELFFDYECLREFEAKIGTAQR